MKNRFRLSDLETFKILIPLHLLPSESTENLYKMKHLTGRSSLYLELQATTLSDFSPGSNSRKLHTLQNLLEVVSISWGDEEGTQKILYGKNWKLDGLKS
jgi:hypothetical protein